MNKLRLLLTKITVFVALLFSVAPMFAQTGTPMFSGVSGTSSNAFPFGSTTSNHCQFVYTAGEFTGANAGMITAIYVKPGAAVTTTTFTNFTVRMTQQPASFSVFATGTYLTGLQTCFGPATKVFTSIGLGVWMKIDLTTPFYYDPTQALVVDIQESGYSGTPAGFSIYHAAPTGNKRIYGAYGATAGTAGTSYAYMGMDISATSTNDAGVLSIDSPYIFCSTGVRNVAATIHNFGRNQITSATVNWKVNGVTQTPYSFSGTLDTTGGSGSSNAQVILGSYSFPATTVSIVAWTSSPNSVTDTVPRNDTASTTKHPSMNGTYTVGATGANYTTLAAAANDLSMYGVCGPITINVAAGTYAGRVFLNSVIGVNSTNRISIIGSGPSSCFLDDSIADALVALSQTSYVTFRNFTVTNRHSVSGAGIAVVGNAANTNGSGSSVINCVVNLPNAGTTSTFFGIIASGSATSGSNNYLDSITFDSNIVNGGYYGMEVYGNSTSPSSNYNRFHRVRYNTLNNPVGYGLYMYYIYNATQVLYNNINMAPTASTQYALYHYYCQNSSATQSTQIIGNKIQNPSYFGMYIYYNASTATAPHKIYNNVVYGNQTYSTNYQVYLYTGVACTFEFIHNTLNTNGSAATQYGLYYYNSLNIEGLICKNNIFSMRSTSGTTLYPVYFSSNPTTNIINYNQYYNSLTTTLGYRGAAFTTSTYKTATTGGDSSFNKAPAFTSNTNLSLTDGCVTAFDLTSKVPTDIIGTTRATSPNPGAYEYVSYSLDISANTLYSPVPPLTLGAQNLVVKVKNSGSTTVTSFLISYKLNGGTPVTLAWSGTLNACDTALVVFSGTSQITIAAGVNAIKVYTSAPNGSLDNNRSNDTISVSYNYIAPLSGTYTIGGSGSNYTTISAATLALQTAGISGPVNFVINSGTYNEAVSLVGPVYGTSPTNTITFDGGNASSSIVTSSSSSLPAFMVSGVSYVTVKNLTVTNTAVGTCTGIAIIGSGSSNIGTGCTVKKCIVNIPNNGTSVSYGIIVTGSAAGVADANQLTDSITIDSNSVTGAYYGIQISTNATANASANRGHKVRWNILNNVYYYGIRVYYIYNAVDIIGNTINMLSTNASSYGIYFYYNQNTLAGTNSKIIGNNVYAGYAGIYFYYFASPAGNRIPIINNMFKTYGASAYVASYIYTGVAGGNEIDYYHNSNNTIGGSATYGLYYYNSVGTGTSYFKNNIFSVAGSGTYPAYFSTNPTGNVINYNIYYNAANGNLIYRGAAYNSSGYLSATVGGDSSFNIAPSFIASTDLHVTNACIRGVNLLSTVTNDIDGNSRSSSPVIGAHETAGLARDIAVTQVIYTTPITTGLQNIKVMIRNYSTVSVTSMNISYVLNSGTPVTIAWTGTLAGCDTTSYTFVGSNRMNLPAGANVLKVYTSAPNGLVDNNLLNDTITSALTTISKIAGNAFVGNGIGGNLVRYAHMPSQNPTTAMTVEAWIKTTSNTTDQKFVCKSSVSDGFCLGVGPASPKLDPEFWTIANGTGSLRMVSVGTSLPNNVIPANTWTHVAATWQSGVGVRAYINGQLVGYINSATVTTITPSTFPLVVGANSWDLGIATLGNVDEVRVWNVALDSFAIRKNMHRTLIGNETGLISYLQLNEPISATLLCDPISGAVGTKLTTGLIVPSTLAVGDDSTTIFPAVSLGSFAHKNLSMVVYNGFDSLVDLALTEISLAPNVVPTATHNLSKYWVARPFGYTGTFLSNLTFTLPYGQLITTDANLKLYYRDFGSDGAWNFKQTASTSNITTTTVMFTGIDTLGQFTLASNGTSPLPVSLTQFGGKRIGADVKLNWLTANEMNCQGFEVERSIDADHFDFIGMVSSKSINSNTNTNYVYVDAKADQNKTLFYRLKQIDFDGKYSYSPIVTISASTLSVPVSLYPNPTKSAFNIDIQSAQQTNVTIVIVDMQGRVVVTKEVQTNKGMNTISVDEASGLNTGVYFVKVKMANDSQIFKLVKTN